MNQLLNRLHDYLNLQLSERKRLDRFSKKNREYLLGDDDNQIIKGLCNAENAVGARQIAMQCHYTQQLVRLFDDYTKENTGSRKRTSLFVAYLKTTAVGRQLYQESFKENLCRIRELAAEERPEILQAWPKRAFERYGLAEMVNDILAMFESYITNKRDGERFCLYSERLRKLNPKYFSRIRSGKNRHLIKRVFEKACRLRPDISKYSKQSHASRDYWREQLVKIFDFYLQHSRSSGFNTSYICFAPELRKAFGTLGNQTYKYAQNHLRAEGGFAGLVRLAAQHRPEILNYWKRYSKGMTSE